MNQKPLGPLACATRARANCISNAGGIVELFAMDQARTICWSRFAWSTRKLHYLDILPCFVNVMHIPATRVDMRVQEPMQPRRALIEFCQICWECTGVA